MYLASTSMFSFIRICGGRGGVRILDMRLFMPLLYYLSYPAIYLSVIH